MKVPVGYSRKQNCSEANSFIKSPYLGFISSAKSFSSWTKIWRKMERIKLAGF
jgi:hypothetical protein